MTFLEFLDAHFLELLIFAAVVLCILLFSSKD